MTTCQMCGEPTVFLNGPKGHTLPAMESAGLAFIAVSDGRAVKTMTYRPHVCEIVTTMKVESVTWTQMREAVYEEAKTRECPKCLAVVGEECWDLAERRRGEKKHTVWPHEERRGLPVAQRGLEG